MIKPYGFGYNAQTANNNYFQHSDLDASKSEITSNALLEFDGMVEMLSRHGINVMVYDNRETLTTPDAVFPNNWISTHSNGTVVLYPMFAPNRRKERNPAVIELLTNTHHFKANKIASIKKTLSLTGQQKSPARVGPRVGEGDARGGGGA